MSAMEYAATYPGDRSEDLGQITGPNANGYYFVASGAEYSQIDNKTRLTFTPLSADESKVLLKEEGYIS